MHFSIRHTRDYCSRSLRFWAWVGKRFIKDNCLQRASSLTFTTLLALVPLIVVMFAALSMFPIFDKATDLLQKFVFENFVPQAGATVQHYLIVFQQQASRLPMFAFVFLFATALMMMITMEKTLNDMWQVTYRRRLRGSILLYWAVLTIGPLLIGMSLVMSSYLASLHWLESIDLVKTYTHHLLDLLPIFFTILAFCFLYMVVPHCSVKFRHAIVGAIVGTILFELTKSLFGLYVTHFPTYKIIYGALASIPIFLLWVYLSWIIFLVGAEVVNALRLGQAQRSAHEMLPMIVALIVLEQLWHAQKAGKMLSLQQLLDENECSVDTMKYTLQELQALSIVESAHEDHYMIHCDVYKTTVLELQEKLRWYLPSQIKLLDRALKPLEGRLNRLLHRQFAATKKVLNIPLSELFEDKH